MLQELLEEFINQEEIHRFEGDIKNLTKVVEALGYKKSQFGQSSLEIFLCDNPGAQEAVINWILEQSSPEWEEEILSCLNAVE